MVLAVWRGIIVQSQSTLGGFPHLILIVMRETKHNIWQLTPKRKLEMYGKVNALPRSRKIFHYNLTVLRLQRCSSHIHCCISPTQEVINQMIKLAGRKIKRAHAPARALVAKLAAVGPESVSGSAL
jgi:hypothetical protein